MTETKNSDKMPDHAIAGNATLPIVSWCCTCDRELTYDNGIGPFNHLTDEPSHYVVQVQGRLDVWRHLPENVEP